MFTFEGDSFISSFGTPADAVSFAMDVQFAMLQAKWPEEALRWPSCRPEKNKAGTQYIWGGLRVRCGIHCGVPTCNVDPTTGRMDYLGI